MYLSLEGTILSVGRCSEHLGDWWLWIKSRAREKVHQNRALRLAWLTSWLLGFMYYKTWGSSHRLGADDTAWDWSTDSAAHRNQAATIVNAGQIALRVDLTDHTVHLSNQIVLCTLHWILKRSKDIYYFGRLWPCTYNTILIYQGFPTQYPSASSLNILCSLLRIFA